MKAETYFVVVGEDDNHHKFWSTNLNPVTWSNDFSEAKRYNTLYDSEFDINLHTTVEFVKCLFDEQKINTISVYEIEDGSVAAQYVIIKRVD